MCVWRVCNCVYRCCWWYIRRRAGRALTSIVIRECVYIRRRAGRALTSIVIRECVHLLFYCE